MKRWLLAMVSVLALASGAAASWQEVLRAEDALAAQDDSEGQRLSREVKAIAALESQGAAADIEELTARRLRLLLAQVSKWDVEEALEVPAREAEAWLDRQREALVAEVERLASWPVGPFEGEDEEVAVGSALELAYVHEVLWRRDAEAAAVDARCLALAQARGDDRFEGKIRIRQLYEQQVAGEYASAWERAEEVVAAWQVLAAERRWPRETQAQILFAQAMVWHQVDWEAHPEALARQVEALMAALALARDRRLHLVALDYLADLRHAEMTLALPQVIAPEGRRVCVRYRNLTQLRLEVLSGSGQRVLERDYPLQERAPYAASEAEVELPALEMGKYRLVFSAEGKLSAERVTQTFPVQVATFSVALVREQEGVAGGEKPALRFFVGDTRTGEAVAGARVRVAGAEGVSDALGVAVVPVAAKAARGDEPVEVVAEARGERVACSLKPWMLPREKQAESAKAARRFEWMTQCPIYRSGETVHFELLGLRQRQGAAAEVLAGEEVTLRLEMEVPGEQKARVLLEERVKLSAHGSWSGSVALPAEVVGNLFARVDKRYCGSVEVMAIRPATFTVSLERASEGVPLDQPQRFTGRAVERNGLPLTAGEVRWRAGEQRGVCAVQADGAFAFEVMPRPSRAEEQRLVVEVAVVRENGERQEADWDAWVPQAGYRMEAELPARMVAGEPFEVRVESSFAQASGVLRFTRQGAETEETVRVPVAQPGVVSVTLPAGKWMCDVVDQQAKPLGYHETAVVVPTSGDFPFGPEADKGLIQLACRGEAYAPGEVVEGYADIPGAGPCFLQVVWQAGQGTRVETLPLPPSRRFAWQVPAEAVGEMLLAVYGFDRAGFVAAEAQCEVQPKAQLQVEAVRVAEVVAPGSEQVWEVAVDDPRAELLATCYDAAMEDYAELSWRRLVLERLFVPSERYLAGVRRDQPLGMREVELREVLVCDPYAAMLWLSRKSADPWGEVFGGARYLGDTASCVVMEAPEEETDRAAAGGEAPRMRQHFARAALWAPQKRVEGGRARFRLTMPDSLTQWRLCVLAYTPDGRSGTLERTVLSRQEVALQPYLPRQLRVGDRLTVQVEVRNATDQPRETWVELNGGERRAVSLPAQGSARVAWEVAAQASPGVQVFAFSSPEDAVRLEVPVASNRVSVEEVWPVSVAVCAGQVAEVRVPEAAQGGEVEVAWGALPLEAVRESLGALVEKPGKTVYDCYARLEAMVLLGRLTGRAPDPEALKATVAEVLSARKGKSWPWLAGGSADSCVTGSILLGIARLKALGLAPEPLEAAAVELLASPEAESLPEAVRLYARTVWPEAGTPTHDELLMAAERVRGCDQTERLVALAALRVGEARLAQGTLERLLASARRDEVEGLSWPQGERWLLWWSSPLESHALGVALLRETGRREEARLAARWLLQHRRRNSWGSARATLCAVYALLRSGEAEPGSAAEVRLVCEALPVVDPAIRCFRFERPAEGWVFGRLLSRRDCTLAELAAMPSQARGDLSLSRRVTPAAPQVGEVLTVQLRVQASQPMNHLVLRDERPANAEPLRQTPWWDWSAGAYCVPDETGLTVFLSFLPRGEPLTLTYELKRTHAGHCQTPPATLRSFVSPDFATYATDR